jgi:hypothetical protein
MVMEDLEYLVAIMKWLEAKTEAIQEVMKASGARMKACQETMELIQENRETKAKAIQNKTLAKVDTTISNGKEGMVAMRKVG